MAFFNSAVDVLQTLVVALGAGLGIWGVINLKMCIRDRTLADERIARAIRENNARLVIIDPVQAFLGTDVDMNRANEVRPIFRLSLIHI